MYILLSLFNMASVDIGERHKCTGRSDSAGRLLLPQPVNQVFKAGLVGQRTESDSMSGIMCYEICDWITFSSVDPVKLFLNIVTGNATIWPMEKTAYGAKTKQIVEYCLKYVDPKY